MSHVVVDNPHGLDQQVSILSSIFFTFKDLILLCTFRCGEEKSFAGSATKMEVMSLRRDCDGGTSCSFLFDNSAIASNSLNYSLLVTWFIVKYPKTLRGFLSSIETRRI